MPRSCVRQIGMGGVAALALAALQAVAPPSMRAQPAPVVVADQVASPQFRSGVARVTVEAVVVDEGGAPVRNLGPADFVLAIDGRPRRIESVSLVSFGGASAAGPREAPLPEVSTNIARTPSRTILLVFDRASLTVGDSLRVRQATSDFIARLQPADRLGLVSLPDGPGVEPTRDHQRVATALAEVTGTAADPTWPRVGFREAFDIDRGRPDALAPVVARECQRNPMPETCGAEVRQRARQVVIEGNGRAQAMLTGLAATVTRFAAVPGPKSMVLMSQGLPYGDRIPREVGEIGRAASRAALPIYSVQLAPAAASAAEAGPPPDLRADQAMLADALWGFARASGGNVLAPVGRLESAFERVARELSASYVLSFDVEPGDRDGASHRIDLTLARGSSRLLRYRREFTSAPAGEAVGEDSTLDGLINSGDVRSDLPLQVSTFTAPRADAVGQRTTVWARVGAVTATTIRVAIFDARNIRVADVTEQVTPPGSGAPVHQGLDHIVSAGLPDGRYVLRVAARDAEGRAGSVEHAFDARLAGTRELRVGSLMLLDERSVRHEAPTPILEARRAVAFRAYLELQSDSALDWSTVQATLEAVDVATGGVRLTRPLALLDADQSSRRLAQAVVPLSGWARGTYILRAIVSRAGQTVATVSRGLVVDTGTPQLTTMRSEPGAAAPPVADTVTAADDAIAEVVALGTRFVDDHNERSAAVVAEEQYVQVVLPGPPEPQQRNVNPALEWRPDFSRAPRGVRDAKLRRQMVSDVLTVRTSEGQWTNYRDVAVVDGRKVGDRSTRALELFSAGGKALGARLRQVIDESSRHNLGVTNSFNQPMLPLQVLHSGSHRRFDFGSGAADVVDGVPTVVITYREVRAPTFIVARPGNTPLFIEGKLWIVPTDGRVLRSELVVRDQPSRLTATMVVEYRPVAELGLVMPIEMWERYVYDNRNGEYVERRARYSNYRRFAVSTDEAVTER